MWRTATGTDGVGELRLSLNRATWQTESESSGRETRAEKKRETNSLSVGKAVSVAPPPFAGLIGWILGSGGRRGIWNLSVRHRHHGTRKRKCEHYCLGQNVIINVLKHIQHFRYGFRAPVMFAMAFSSVFSKPRSLNVEWSRSRKFHFIFWSLDFSWLWRGGPGWDCDRHFSWSERVCPFRFPHFLAAKSSTFRRQYWFGKRVKSPFIGSRSSSISTPGRLALLPVVTSRILLTPYVCGPRGHDWERIANHVDYFQFFW